MSRNRRVLLQAFLFILLVFATSLSLTTRSAFEGAGMTTLASTPEVADGSGRLERNLFGADFTTLHQLPHGDKLSAAGR